MAEIDQVGIGVHVVIELVNASGQGEPMEFDIVRDQFADLDTGLLSSDTPLARALLGKFVGATLAYCMGDVTQVRIVRIGPRQHEAPADRTQQRQTALEDARRKVEQTNADMFASSYSGKWGDYATDGLSTDDDDA